MPMKKKPHNFTYERINDPHLMAQCMFF